MKKHYQPLFITLSFLVGFFPFFNAHAALTEEHKKNNEFKKQVKQKTKHSKNSEKILAQQRLLFQKSEALLKSKQYGRYKKQFKKLSDLGDYPLLPYLHYQYLRKNLSLKNSKEIDAFISKNVQIPYANRLRRHWLNYLARYKKWDIYLDVYPQSEIDSIFSSTDILSKSRPIADRISKKTTERACFYLEALSKTNQLEKALPLVEKLWLSNHSQPKACDAIFKHWGNTKYLTDSLRWQRIEQVMKKNKLALAKFIAKKFRPMDKQILSQWIALHRKPQELVKSSVFKIKHPIKQKIIQHSIKRLARKQTKKLAKLLDDEKFSKKLNSQNKQYASKELGLILAKRHQPDAWLWLDNVADNESDKEVREWRVRAAIRDQNWSNVIGAIKRLSPQEQKSKRWQYWFAKSHWQLGKEATAKKIFTTLANSRSYYSFLSADHMNTSYNFDNKVIVTDKKQQTKLQQHPSIRRAYEFYSQNMQLQARREWHYATHQLFSPKEKVIAAKIAQSWGWHDRAILTIAYTPERDDLKLRFPVSYSQLVEEYSSKNTLDKTYTYAIIRRESAFSQQVRSPVGAMGLMQVMPKTGKFVAKKGNIKFKNKRQLYQPEFNIKIGTRYLSSMLSNFDQQIILASSAYNAGPHRVKKWLKNKKYIDAQSWIETIPFKETREYVSAILMYRAIYQYRLSLPISRLEEQMQLFNQQQTIKVGKKLVKSNNTQELSFNYMANL